MTEDNFDQSPFPDNGEAKRAQFDKKVSAMPERTPDTRFTMPDELKDAPVTDKRERALNKKMGKGEDMPIASQPAKALERSPNEAVHRELTGIRANTVYTDKLARESETKLATLALDREELEFKLQTIQVEMANLQQAIEIETANYQLLRNIGGE